MIHYYFIINLIQMESYLDKMKRILFQTPRQPQVVVKVNQTAKKLAIMGLFKVKK